MKVILFFFFSLVASKAFNVKDYGAKGDNVTSDTLAIHRTFRAADESGGGTIIFPAGSYRLTTIEFVSNIEVVFEPKAQLLFFNDYKTWRIEGNYSYHNLIEGMKVSNITIHGKGVINGNGGRWWDAWREGKLEYRRPNLFHIQWVKNFTMRDVTLIDSPMYNVYTLFSEDISIKSVTVRSPFFKHSVNTDGFDFRQSTNIHVSDCVVSNSDDAVAIQDGTSNVLIENCHFFTGHGASIGSLWDSGSVENVTFQNITFNGTYNGIRIKTKEKWEGYVRNVTWKGIDMINVSYPIILNMFYPVHPTHRSKSLLQNENGTRIVSRNKTKSAAGIYDIVIEDFKSVGGEHAGFFLCRDDLHCTNIHLREVKVIGSKDPDFHCLNAFGDDIHVSPDSCLK